MSAFARDVLAGLSRRPRAIPPVWFYDEAGSALFEAITATPEYYPTRVETALLADRAAALAQVIPPGAAVVEFGAGSATKTPLLLAAVAPAAYVPVDVSGVFLRASAAALSERFPGLPVLPVEADFTAAVPLPDAIAALPRLGFFPGSTIGNFAPAAAVDLLRRMRGGLGPHAQLLLGLDRVKPLPTLLAAYDDAGGVTAAFNRNLLHRINRELSGDIPVEAFAHEARWNPATRAIEMHLRATRPLAFTVAGTAFAMAAGETIHTENSHKYGRDDADLLLRAGGWEPEAAWHAPDEAFSLILARAAPDAA